MRFTQGLVRWVCVMNLFGSVDASADILDLTIDDIWGTAQKCARILRTWVEPKSDVSEFPSYSAAEAENMAFYRKYPPAQVVRSEVTAEGLFFIFKLRDLPTTDPRFVTKTREGYARIPHPFTLNRLLGLDPKRSSIYFVPKHWSSDDELYWRGISKGKIHVSMEDLPHDIGTHGPDFYALSQTPEWELSQLAIHTLQHMGGLKGLLKRDRALRLLEEFGRCFESAFLDARSLVATRRYLDSLIAKTNELMLER